MYSPTFWIESQKSSKVTEKNSETSADSGIVNDPNDWCKEQGNDRYIVDLIKRVVHLSVEGVKIIEGLPKVEF